jgi:hypothetical protein
MPLPVITNGFYCAYRTVQGGVQSAEQTFTVESGTGMSTADVAGILETAWGDNIDAVTSNFTALTSISVQPLDGVSSADVYPAEGTGTVTGDALPASICMITTLRTGEAGRSKRGRIFWGGMTSTQLATSHEQWSATTVSNWQGAVDTWLSDLAGEGLTLEVLSRELGVGTTVSTIVARSYIGTQRRRLTGGIIF